MTVFWTRNAIVSLSKIIDYLREHWTEKEVVKFTADIRKSSRLIQKNPYIYMASGIQNEIRKGFVNKKVRMFYKINLKKNRIDILLFWDNRQNPKKHGY
jgi:plasmid stabilization system protein ParE